MITNPLDETRGLNYTNHIRYLSGSLEKTDGHITTCKAKNTYGTYYIRRNRKEIIGGIQIRFLLKIAVRKN